MTSKNSGIESFEISDDIDDLNGRPTGLVKEGTGAKEVVKAIACASMIIIAVLLPTWFIIELVETEYDYGGSYHGNRGHLDGANRYYESDGCSCYIHGNVTSSGKLFAGATVIISDTPVYAAGEFDFGSAEMVDSTISDDSGEFILTREVYANNVYYITASAAYHEIKVIKFRVLCEGDEDMRIDLGEPDLTFHAQDILTYRMNEFRMDILDHNYLATGVQSVLLNKTLIATLRWNNSFTSGGDLSMGYEVTCTDPEFDAGTEMPWHRNNVMTMTVHINDDLFENIYGCGGADYAVFYVWVSVEKWGHDVHFDLTIEIVE